MTRSASSRTPGGSASNLGCLADLLNALVEASEAEAVNTLLGDRLPTLLGCDRIQLALIDAETGLLRSSSGDALHGAAPGEINLALARCLRDREIVSLKQLDGGNGTSSTLVAPLVVAGKAVGALAAMADRTDAFTDTDRQLLRSVAATSAVVLLSCLDRNSELSAVRDESRQAHEELQAALQAIPHPVVIYDKDFNFRAWNTEFTRIQGYTEELMQGFGGMAGLIRYEVEELKSFGDQTFEAVYQQYLDYYKFQDFNQSIQYWPMRGKHIDRRTRRTASGGWVSVLVDITDWVNAQEEIRSAKEEAESAARAKSEFLANMSHEIRTPLNAVIGFTQLVLQGNLTEKQRDHLTRVEISGQLLLRILDDILDFSRIDAGMLELEHVPFELDDVLGNLVDLTGNRLKSSDVELLLSVDDEVPHRLLGDPLRLAQILLNLGSNAAKFTDQGTIHLRVRLVQRSRDAATLRFEVEDTGIGMTQEQSDRLFQAFTQADTSTTRRYGGSGLGLAISKALTEIMDGQIGVESAKDRGSTFHLTIRLALPKDDRGSQPPRPRGVGWLRALVIDDYGPARDALCRSIAQLGVTVSSVADTETALAALRDSTVPFDVVLLDHGLADSTIVGRLQAVLQERPPGWDDPVGRLLILMTGHLPGGPDFAGAEELADGTVSKAATPSRMRDALMGAFGRRPIDAPSLDPEIRKALSGLHVLVAEDNEVNQLVAREMLEVVGARVTIAENGRRALDILRAGTRDAFSAVLMDLQMPEMDGLTATRSIRQVPAFQNLPIIAMTANAFNEDRRRSREAGMVEHVSKPVDPHRLYAILIEHTSRPKM
jgi:PAS domain S-box-containing protein